MNIIILNRWLVVVATVLYFSNISFAQEGAGGKASKPSEEAQEEEVTPSEAKGDKQETKKPDTSTKPSDEKEGLKAQEPKNGVLIVLPKTESEITNTKPTSDIANLTGLWCADKKHSILLKRATLFGGSRRLRCRAVDHVMVTIETQKNEGKVDTLKGTVNYDYHNSAHRKETVEVPVTAENKDNQIIVGFTIPEERISDMDSIMRFAGIWDGKDTIEGEFVIRVKLKDTGVSNQIILENNYTDYSSLILAAVTDSELVNEVLKNQGDLAISTCAENGLLSEFSVNPTDGISGFTRNKNITCAPGKVFILLGVHSIDEDSNNGSITLNSYFYTPGITLLNTLVNKALKEAKDNASFYQKMGIYAEEVVLRFLKDFSIIELIHPYLRGYFIDKLTQKIDSKTIAQQLELDLQELKESPLDYHARLFGIRQIYIIQMHEKVKQRIREYNNSFSAHLEYTNS